MELVVVVVVVTNDGFQYIIVAIEIDFNDGHDDNL